MSASLAASLDAALRGADLTARLRGAAEAIPGRLVLTTSFGAEDQVIAHAAFTAGLAVEVVTLDTGRLFPETHAVWAATEALYGRRIRALAPEREPLEALVAAQGIDGFRASVAARVACCEVRKVEPLARALAGAAGWVTGLRAGQSAGRAATPLAAFDEARGLVKVNPLADWDREAVAAYAARHGVPLNALHGRGFPSVGCAPCTRAVRPGEPERAGRWWWEDEGRQECGLHLRPRPVPEAASSPAA